MTMSIEKNAHEILLVAGDVWRAGYPMNPVGAFSNAHGVYNGHFGRYIFKRHGYRNNILLLDGDVENINYRISVGLGGNITGRRKDSIFRGYQNRQSAFSWFLGFPCPIRPIRRVCGKYL